MFRNPDARDLSPRGLAVRRRAATVLALAVGLCLVVPGMTGVARAATAPSTAPTKSVKPTPAPTKSVKPTPAPTKTTSPSTTPPSTPCPTPTGKCVAPQITEFVPPVRPSTKVPTKVVDGRVQVLGYPADILATVLRTTATPPVVVKGTGQAGTKVTLYREGSSPGSAVNCTATVAANGTWSCSLPWSAFPMPRVAISGANYQTYHVPDSDGAVQMIGVKSSCGAKGKLVKVVSAATSPIAIDFSGSGEIQTVGSAQAPSRFALLKDKAPVASGWLAPTAGFLAVDLDGDGRITSIDELFGGGVGDGFAKLADYDTDGNGVIDARDVRFQELSVWRDLDLDKVTDPGELTSLTQAGVVALNLAHRDYWELDAAGNSVYEHSSATMADGAIAAMNDVYFALG